MEFELWVCTVNAINFRSQVKIESSNLRPFRKCSSSQSFFLIKGNIIDIKSDSRISSSDSIHYKSPIG